MNILNQVNLIGRLTRNNEISQYRNQKGEQGIYLKNSLAVSGKTKDSPSNFINITVWGASADYLFKYTQKGDMIAVFGELTQNVWTDKQNNTHYDYFVNVENVKLLYQSKDNRQQNNFNGQPPQQQNNFYNQAQQPQFTQPQQQLSNNQSQHFQSQDNLSYDNVTEPQEDFDFAALQNEQEPSQNNQQKKYDENGDEIPF